MQALENIHIQNKNVPQSLNTIEIEDLFWNLTMFSHHQAVVKRQVATGITHNEWEHHTCPQI